MKFNVYYPENHTCSIILQNTNKYIYIYATKVKIFFNINIGLAQWIN